MRIGNVIVSVSLFVISWLILGSASEFPKRVSNAPGPGYYPSLLAYGFIAMAVLLLLETAVRKDYPKVVFNSPGTRRAYVAMGLGLLYFLMMYFGLGYPVASFIFSAALLWLLRFTGVWAVAASVLIPLGIYILFTVFLETPLPEFELHDGVAQFMDSIVFGIRNFFSGLFK